MSSVPVPEDIVITILEEFDVQDQDDRLAIQTCAFLSRSVLYHCRRLLFSTFKVGEKPAFSHCDLAEVDANVALHRFHNLLSSHRHLIPFVLNVILIDVPFTKILSDVQLPNLLRLLTRVVRLQVFVSDGTRKWASLHDDLTYSLSSLMSQPHFETLKLCGLSDLPIQPFVNSAGLKNLSIHDVRGLTYEDTDSDDEGIDDGTIKLLEARFLEDLPPRSPTSSPAHFAFIDSLSFGGSSDFFIKYLQEKESLNRFSRLRSLSVNPKTALDVKVAWLIIRHAAETLLSFGWSFSHVIPTDADDDDEWEEVVSAMGPPSTGSIILSAIGNLTTLSFTVTFLWSETLPHPLITWNNFLATASPLNPMRFLRTIIVTFDCLLADNYEFKDYDAVAELFSDVTQTTWDRFTDVLGSSKCFPALKELVISILVPPRLSTETESSVGSEWGGCKCSDCVDVEMAASDVDYESDYPAHLGTNHWNHFDNIPRLVKERMSWLRREGLHFCIEVISD